MIGVMSQVNREMSKELSMDEKLIRSVNAFFWKKVRDNISTAEHTSIRINNFGTYVISRRKVQTYIKKLIKEIRYFRSSTKQYVRKTREEYIEDRLSELRILLVRRNDIAVIYKQNEDKIRAKKNMGKQIPDTSGTEE